MHDLCAVAAEKCDIGTRIRAAYDAGDKKQLKKLAKELRRIRDLVEKFYRCLRKQWMKENKPHGFDVSDVRIGGVITACSIAPSVWTSTWPAMWITLRNWRSNCWMSAPPLSPDYGKRKYLNYWDRNARQHCDIVTANMLFKPRTC